jgi:subtilase family serine protease
MKISIFLYTLLLAVLVLPPARVRAQTYLLPTTGTANYTTCAGTLYDDGGPDNFYDTEARGSVTLRPGTAGGKIKLAFSLLELDSVRCNVTVYDGLDTNAPYISKFYHGLPTVYATGSTGALTVVFSSYGGQARRGIAAAISCVTSAPPTDLAMQNLRLDVASVPTNDDFEAAPRVANLSGPLTPYTLRYLLSTDKLASTNDEVLGTSTWSLAQGDCTSSPKTLRVPTYMAPGAYYVLAEVVPSNAAVYDINYTNNVAWAPLTVLAQTLGVDLAITDATNDTYWPVAAGEYFYARERVQNLGRTLAMASQVGYYLSADATLSPDDTLLGTELAEVPIGNKFTSMISLLSLPENTALGTYYLLSVADYDDQVIEDNEQNNVRAQKLTVVPPVVNVWFESTRTVAPTQPAAGGNLYVRCSMQNKGSAPIDSVSVGYYLSADQALGADDILLDQASVQQFAAGPYAYYTITRTLTIPVGTPLGKRYLLLAADPLNQLAESNETDNLVAIALTIVVPVVDIAISSLQYNGTSPPAGGSLLSLRYNLSNLGTTQAYPVEVGYYLSTDNLLSDDDVLLRQPLKTSLTLAGGASQVSYVSDPYGPFLPANTPPGAYYLLAVADHLAQLPETNEANNVAAVAIQVGLPVVDLSLDFKPNVLPTQTSIGTVINLGYYLYNTGTTPARTPVASFYLSTDKQLSSDDILIEAERIRNTLYPNGSVYRSGGLAIPPTIAPRKYYLLGAVDYLNEFAETDETNNVQAVALGITSGRPNLAVQAGPYLSSKQMVAGSTVATESYVNNIGAGLASASTVGYYLSTDPVFTPDDVLLGSTPVAEVQPYYSATVPGRLTVPAATAGGRYYVLFVADHLNKLDDIDRSNNVGRTTITITALPLATREQTAGYELHVSPVPAPSGKPVRVQFSGSGARTEASLGLYNNLGQLLTTRGLVLGPGQANEVEISTAGLAAGVYILRLTGPNLAAVRRVVVD